MTRDEFDLIVIGAGTAARDGAKKAVRDYGANVVLIERTRWGGSCPNVACNPTKAYLTSAELAHDVNSFGDLLGLEVGPAVPKLAKVKARKDGLQKLQSKWLAELSDSYETIKGEATLIDANTARVGERDLRADRILIATGSRTAVPPVEGLDEIEWIDHVSALELTELPEQLLVLGGGPTGLELGQAFSRFGSKVTIAEPEQRVAGRSDADAALELTRALEDEGIEIATTTKVERVRNDGDAIVATLAVADGDKRELRVAQVLIAAGRKPNVEELSLEEIGVETSEKGHVVVDERMRTTIDGIWAAGDVTGVAEFTPVAQYQARIAIADMFGDSAPSADYSAVPTVIFTDPELAGVGLSEQKAIEEGFAVDSATHELANQTRARYHDTKRGLFKLVFERSSGRLLGLHVVSRNASDVVAGFSVAMNLGVTVDDIARAHHAYPTFGEGIKAAAERAKSAVAA